MVLTAQNGIPWWYFFKHGGPYEGRTLESVDPGGVIAAGIAARARHRQRRLSGGRDHLARRHQAHRGQPLLPGGDRQLLERAAEARFGELSARPASRRRSSPTCAPRSGRSSGATCRFNPISALTHATLEDLCRFPLDARACRRHDARGAGDRRGARHPLPHARSRNASPAARRSVRTRPRCCRTSKPAARSKPTRSSARSSSLAASAGADAASRHRLRAGQALGQDVADQRAG